MKDNKYKYLAKNTLVFAVSSFGSKLLVFFLVPFYTRVLSKAEYGTADLVTTTSSLLIFVVTICIADAVIRFAIDGKEARYGVFRFGLKVEAIGCLAFGIILLTVSFYNPFHWEKYLYFCLYLTLVSSALNQIASNYLRAIDKIKAVGIMGIVVTIVTIISNLVLLLGLKCGVVGYLISYILGHVASSIYGFSVILRYDKECFSQICDKETKRSMIMYSLPLIFNGLAWWVNSSLDRYFIIFFYSASVNGLYAVASKIPTILNAVNQIFSQAWNLSAIKEYDEEDKTGFFKNVYSTYNFVLVSSCSILILFNIPLAKVLFANDFFEAWQFSSILLISTVFSAMSSFIGSIFVAVRNSKIFAISTVTAAAINAFLNWILIPPYGALGAAVATAISFFVIWFLRYICAVKYIKLKINIIKDLTCYVLVVIQTIIEHLTNHYYLIHIPIIILILILYREEAARCANRIKNIATKIIDRR